MPLWHEVFSDKELIQDPLALNNYRAGLSNNIKYDKVSAQDSVNWSRRKVVRNKNDPANKPRLLLTAEATTDNANILLPIAGSTTFEADPSRPEDVEAIDHDIVFAATKKKDKAPRIKGAKVAVEKIDWDKIKNQNKKRVIKPPIKKRKIDISDDEDDNIDAENPESMKTFFPSSKIPNNSKVEKKIASVGKKTKSKTDYDSEVEDDNDIIEELVEEDEEDEDEMSEEVLSQSDSESTESNYKGIK